MTAATVHDSPELAELGDVVRRFALDRHPTADARRRLESGDGYDPGAWATLTDELALMQLLGDDVPGLPWLEAMLCVQRAFGRTIAASPWFGTAVLAGTVLRAVAGPPTTLGILHGRTATLIPPTKPLLHGPDALARAESTTSGMRLETTGITVDGATADVLVVLARSPAGETLVATVDASDAGVHRASRDILDATRPVARMTLRGAVASHVWACPQNVLERALAEVHLLNAAEMAATARACLDASVAYADHRVAFGQPIGAFQAVKHALADLFVDITRVDALVSEAVRAHGRADFPHVAHLAIAAAGETVVAAAERQIAVHGGIGFTWEHDAHLFHRRALGSSILLGHPTEHWDAAAGHALAP